MKNRSRSSKRMAAVFVVAATAAACGGKVTFVAGSGTGGEGGAGPNECVLGHCGDACIACVGDQCTNGRCDADGLCQSPNVAITCPP